MVARHFHSSREGKKKPQKKQQQKVHEVIFSSGNFPTRGSVFSHLKTTSLWQPGTQSAGARVIRVTCETLAFTERTPFFYMP